MVSATTTSGTGSFQIVAPSGQVRVAVETGSLDTRAAKLPDTFRWTGDARLKAGQAITVTLPETRSVTVASTDAAGAPLAAAGVTAPDTRPAAPAVLWPGGPVMTGTQQVAARSVATDSAGRAQLRAFATYDLGNVRVEHSPSPGVSERTTLASLAVQDDLIVVAVPSRPTCTPRAVPDLAGPAVPLVSDLDRVTLGQSSSRAPLMTTADRIVTGAIPRCRTTLHVPAMRCATSTTRASHYAGSPGILAYAYAVDQRPEVPRHDGEDCRGQRSRLAGLEPRARPRQRPRSPPLSRSPTGWSAARMTTAQRATVAARLLTTRMVMAYSCADGALVQASDDRQPEHVIATAADLDRLACAPTRPGWASVGVADGTVALARLRDPDRDRASLADGPTVEGLMYSTYEAANLALLHATQWRNRVGRIQ